MTPLMDRWEDYDHLAFEERCYEYDKAECYQNNIEEQVDNESNQNPQRRKRKRKLESI